ncbi:MAG TPA: ABC transporter permease [Paracoccaceae bacterium]|nr:ABC transporter permease [Paracoccaceae bacterium]
MTRLAPWLLVAPALAFVAALLLGPIGATIGTTFAADEGALQPYAAFFASGFRRRVLWRTLEISLVTTLIALALGFAAAWVVARAPGRLKSLLLVAAVFPLLTGTVVRSFAWLIILGRNGILNDALLALGLTPEPLALLYTEGAVITGLVYLFTPLMILSLVGVLEAIEPDLLHAAASLGAPPGEVFRRIVLPLATPGLIVGAVLVFTGSFTAYVTPQLMGGSAQTVLATLMYQRAMVQFDWTGASTIAAIMVAITLATVLGMSRLARRLNPAAA